MEKSNIRGFYIICRPKYPNLNAEMQLRVAGHPDTYCSHAGVTPEIMHKVMIGRDDLSYEEKLKTISTYILNPIVTYEYLFCEELSRYDLRKKKHYRKFQRLYAELHKVMNHPAVKGYFLLSDYFSLSDLMNQKVVTRAHYNKLQELKFELELHISCVTRSSMRSTPLK